MDTKQVILSLCVCNVCPPPHLTKLRWTPSERCTAEQSIQMNIPYVTEAQVGFLAAQSKHNYEGMKESKYRNIHCV